jgi:LEA14-like dessication related protein
MASLPSSSRPPRPPGGRGPVSGVRAALLVALALLLPGCALFYEEPEVRIAEVTLTEVGLSGATVEVGLDVRNPNPGALTSSGLRYVLSFEAPEDGGEEWRTVAEGESTDEVSVPGQETRRVQVAVPFRYDELGRAVAALLQSGELRYRLAGDVDFDAPLGDLRVPFQHTGNLGL